MAIVLVVNDDRDMLDVYAAVLEQMGHRPLLRINMDPKPETVISAGAEAVIIDLQAEADRLAGLRAIEALRAHPATEKVPIVLATAAERLEKLDVPVLLKPFAIDALRDVLGDVLPSRGPRTAQEPLSRS